MKKSFTPFHKHVLYFKQAQKEYEVQTDIRKTNLPNLVFGNDPSYNY